MEIRKGILRDLDQLECLYNDLNDYLESGVNYPGWIKHIYPIRDTARKGIETGELFVFETEGCIAGSVILSHEPENAYDQVKWDSEDDYENITVIRTLVVHPDFMGKGIATALMSFAKEYALQNKQAAIRLDVSENNLAAIGLYEKLGYKYIGTVDLGLPYDHLKWFRLYEMIL